MKKKYLFTFIITASTFIASSLLPLNYGIKAKASENSEETSLNKFDLNKDGLISIGDLSLGYSNKILSNNSIKELSKNLGFFPYKRTLIIGIDGAGNAFYEKAPYYGSSTLDNVRHTPFINEFFKEGAVTHNSMVDMPSNSAPGWVAALHGYSYYEASNPYRITNDIAESTPYPLDSPYPSVFKIAKENFPHRKAASFSNWEGINKGIIENNIGVEFSGGSDKEVTENLVNYIRTGKAKEASMLYVHLNDVDYAGHTKGWFKDEFYKALSEKDDNVKDIINAMKDENLLKDTLIILTTDHGGRDTGHGNEHPETLTTFISFYGPNIKPNKILDGGKQKNIPPIIAKTMNFQPSDNWTGKVFDESMFISQKDLSKYNKQKTTLKLLNTDNTTSLVLEHDENKLTALDVTLLYDPSKINIQNIQLSKDVKVITDSNEFGTLKLTILSNNIKNDVPFLRINYNSLDIKPISTGNLIIDKAMGGDSQGNEILLNVQ